MVGIGCSDHQCIGIGDGSYEDARIASRNDNDLVSYPSLLEHLGETGRIERFRPPSRGDSEAIAGAMRGQNAKQNVALAVHLLCFRLQCRCKRFDSRTAASLGIEPNDNRVTSESARHDLRRTGRLAPKNTLTAEQTE